MKKIGIIGLGFGSHVHIPAFESIPDVEIVAIAGRNIDKVKEIGHRYSIDGCFDSWEKMLEEDLTHVSIALPPILNEQVCLASFSKGIHVLCEKPLASSLAQAELIASRMEASKLMINFQFLELAAFKKLYKIIEKKRFGKILKLDISWHVHSYAYEQAVWSWKVDQAGGGGVLNVLGSHLFYLLEKFFGTIHSVQASLDYSLGKKIFKGKQSVAESSMQGSLFFDEGFSGEISLTNASGGEFLHEWIIHCELGNIILRNTSKDYMNGFSIVSNFGNEENVIYKDSAIACGKDGRIAPFRSLANRFLDDAIMDSSPNAESGVRVQKIIEAVRSSNMNKLIVV